MQNHDCLLDQSSRDPTYQQWNKRSEMKYIANYDECIKRKKIYKNNKIKAYAQLWEICAKITQNFESKIHDNPVDLLKAI